MKIARHSSVENDLKKLKRFAAPEKSLEAWERLFALKGLNETPAIEIYRGFGDRKIYKARVVPLQENLGKSRGYRVLFEVVNKNQIKILIFTRHGIYDSEEELIAIIRERLNN